MVKACFIGLLVTLSTSLQGAPEGTVDLVHLRKALGKDVEIFEVKDGEVSVGLPYLKRLEVSETSVLLTVRNDSKAPITPRIEMEFFNAQGMRLCETFASFETEGVPASSVTAKQVAIIRPELERIFAASAMTLPSLWRTICFVAIRNSNDPSSPRSADVTPPSKRTVQAPKLEQNPLTGLDKKEGESKDGFARNISKIAENTRPITNRIEGVKNVPMVNDALAKQPAMDPQRPRPRPTVVKHQQVRPAIFAENKFGTQNIGPTAVDARWSNYGAYLQRMIESIQLRWEHLLRESTVNLTTGSAVTVKFVMDSKGLIARIVNVDSTAMPAAERACMSAITDRAPYGEWTDDMKAVLGEQQEMTFTFYHQ
jgi:hypothetical protein